MSFNATDPHNHVGKTDSWLTPMFIIDALGNDFDLDPCGFKKHKTARDIYQLPDDGLALPWYGKVWLNPPYSNAKQWLDKMSQHKNGSCLLFSRTGTFGKYMVECDHIFLLRKRVRFLDENLIQAKQNPGCDSMILSWGIQDYSKLDGYQIK